MPGMVNEAAGTVKKLYRFMFESGRISRADFDGLLDDVRACKPEWLELARSYQEWDPDSGERSPLELRCGRPRLRDGRAVQAGQCSESRIR